MDANARIGSISSFTFRAARCGSDPQQLMKTRIFLFAISTCTSILAPTWYSIRAQYDGHRVDYIIARRSDVPLDSRVEYVPHVLLSGSQVIAHVHVHASAPWPAPFLADRSEHNVGRTFHKTCVLTLTPCFIFSPLLLRDCPMLGSAC